MGMIPELLKSDLATIQEREMMEVTNNSSNNSNNNDGNNSNDEYEELAPCIFFIPHSSVASDFHDFNSKMLFINSKTQK